MRSRARSAIVVADRAPTQRKTAQVDPACRRRRSVESDPSRARTRRASRHGEYGDTVAREELTEQTWIDYRAISHTMSQPMPRHRE